jgi:hypothetical protein
VTGPLDLVSTFLLVLDRLERNGIAHMVVGSVASMVYGEPRMTHDMDLVVELQPRDALRLEAMFPLEDFYCPPIEALRAEIVQRGQFNLIHHDSGLKIDAMVRKDTPHARSEFARRRKMAFMPDAEAWFAAPEDVILKKLEFFRLGGSEKHLKDIRGMLAETALDDIYLSTWLDALSLRELWARVAT